MKILIQSTIWVLNLKMDFFLNEEFYITLKEKDVINEEYQNSEKL